MQAPLPKWGGKTNPGVTIGHRADIDVIDWSKNEESKREAGPHYVFIMQDRASRYIWTRPLKTKSAAEVTDALKEILEQAKDEGMEAPQEMNGDLEKPFEANLSRICCKVKKLRGDPKRVQREKI